MPLPVNSAFIAKNERPNAQIRIFCFTYAGASAQSFLTWNNHVPDFIDITGFEMPAHGRRLVESAPCRTHQEAAKYIADTLEPVLDRPYALFGHCLGAVLAYEATRILKSRGAAQPVHLFASGARGPHFGIPIGDVKSMNNEQFIDHFNQVYGASMDILRNPQLGPLVLPVVKADAYMTQEYRYLPGPPVDYDVTVIAGEKDGDVNLEQMQGWTQHTTAKVTTRFYEGNHFFFLERSPQMLADIAKVLEEQLDNRVEKAGSLH
jgi:medium-chain acyl-[acyl-carrier-protein] hydrolase